MDKKKKLINVLFVTVLVIFIIILICKIVLSVFAVYIVKSDETEEIIYFDSPKQCITNQLDQTPASVLKNKIKYDKSIYIYDNENQYVEFFVDNHNSVWCYILDKKTDDDKIEFCKNSFESDVQLGDYYWHNRSVYYYKIVDDKEKIEDYDGIKPVVIEFCIETDAGGKTLYLLFIADDE